MKLWQAPAVICAFLAFVATGAHAVCPTSTVCASYAYDAETRTCIMTANTGVACDDGNACTYGDVCSSTGHCVGQPITCTSDSCVSRSCNGTATCATSTVVQCSLANAAGTCNPANGSCSYTCNPGYQLQGGTCVIIPAQATISAPATATTGTGGLAASVPNQAGASYAWTISGGTITAGLGTSGIAFTAGPAGNLVLSVQVTTVADATASSSATVSIFAIPVATISAPSAVTANVAGLTAAVPTQTGATYSWSISGGTIAAGAASTSVTFTAGASGSVVLTCTVTNGAGSTATSSDSITIYALPVAAITAAAAVTAGTSGISASVPTQSSSTYSWTISGGTIGSDPTLASITFAPGSGSSLTLTCTVTNGAGTSSTASKLINIVPPPDATQTTLSSSETAGVGFTISVPAQAGTFAWTTNGTGAAASVTSGAGSRSISLLPSLTSGGQGTLTVTCTVTNEAGAASTSTRSFSVFAPPDASITFPSSVTEGTAGLTASVSAQAGATYAWTITGGTITAGASSSGVTFTAGPAGTASLTCVVTNGAGATASRSSSVSIFALPDCGIAAPSIVTASMAGLTANVAVQAGAAYSWTLAGGTITAGAGTNGITFTAGTGASMTLSCSVTNGAGANATASKTIAIAPAPQSNISVPTAVTSGATFSASVASQSGTFSWSVSGSGASAAVVSGAGTNSVTINPSLQGGPGTLNITCTVTNAAGSTSTSTSSLSVFAAPDASMTFPSSVTAGTAGLTASVSAQVGASYAWTITGGTITGGGSSSAVTFTAGPAGTASLTSVVTNGAGAAASRSSSISIYVPPDCGIAAPSIVTAGMTGLAANVSVQPGAAYSWTLSGGTITAGASTNGITFTAGTGASMTLSCSVTNGAGANATASTTISIAPAPLSTITAWTAATSGISFSASVPSQSGTFSWDITGSGASAVVVAGAGTNSVTINPSLQGSSGTLTLSCTVTNAAGTASSSTFSVSVYAPPATTISAASAVTAYSSGLSASVTSQPGATYNWTIGGGSISSGQGTNAISYAAGGSGTLTVSCTVTNGASVSSTGSIAVLVAPIPATPVISANSMVTDGLPGWTASVAANPGMTYLWTIAGATITSAGGTSGAANGAFNAITYTPTGTPGGIVTITCTEINAAGAASTAGSASASIVPQPIIPTIAATGPVTSGVDGFRASVAARSGMFYSWTLSGASITSAGGAGGQTTSGTNAITFIVTAAPGSAITVSCVEINPAGTVSAAYTVSLQAIAAPSTPSIVAPLNVTIGATGIVAYVAAHAGMTYSWTISGGSITSGGGASGNIAGGNDSIAFTVSGPVNGAVLLTCVETNAAGTTSAVATATSTIVDAPTTPSITVVSGAIVAANRSGLTAAVPAHAGMAYAWAIDSSSTSTGAVVAGGAGVTTGVVNTVTFSSGASGTIVLTCVETNAAGVSGQAAVSASITVTLDTTPPLISFTSPSEGSTLTGSAVALTGTASDDFGLASVIVNGQAASVSSGSFSVNLVLARPESVYPPDLPFAPGANTITAVATDLSGNTTQAILHVTAVDTVPPNWWLTDGASLVATQATGKSATLTWTGAYDNYGVTQYQVFKNGALVATVPATTQSITIDGLVVGSGYTFVVQAGDAAGNWSLNGPTLTFVAVPPNPALVAPPLDRTVATSFADATAFLYSGTDPIQQGVLPGTIQAGQAAVLRGTVHTRNGAPLTGVRVTVQNHPEFGWTYSRADGAFDLAVNGGGPLTVECRRDGFLPVQRQLTPQWQDFSSIADLTMIPYDNLVSIVDLTQSSAAQLARGSLSSDGNGSRRGTVLFLPGTQATLLLPDGTSRPLGTLHVRATEFTVGPQGASAMPLDLPKTSAYTYAVSFNVDEALAAGADKVSFNQPVYGYVENFLGFPVGGAVPSGYHDPDRAAWVPEDNGRVVRILDVATGSATVDIDGSGVAATSPALAALGFSDAELQRLAATYAPGQSLWRVPLRHFSSYDWNWAPGLPPNAVPPEQKQPQKADPISCVKPKPGSIIECENQTLGERIAVIGTGYTLNYRSDRETGRRANRRLDLALPTILDYSFPPVFRCDPTWTPTCQNITDHAAVPTAITVRVAGRSFQRQNTTYSAPQTWNYEWDGRDAYGRILQGRVPVEVQACREYPGFVYENPGDAGRAFGLSGGGSISIASVGSNTRMREGWSFMLCAAPWKGWLGGWDAKPEGLGGWSLNAHHSFDARSGTLYRGDGERQGAHELSRPVINTFGGPLNALAETTSLAPQVYIGSAQNAVAPDGTVYFIAGTKIWKFGPDRIVHHVAGTGDYCCDIAEGRPATQAFIGRPNAVALGPDGSLYFAVADNESIGVRNMLRRIRPDGIVVTVAGIGQTGFTADGVLATQAALSMDASFSGGLAIGQDGTIYFADSRNNRVRKVDPDGILRTIAGSGPSGYAPSADTYTVGDGGPALSARLNQPKGITLGPDGALYVADTCNDSVRKVDQTGTITTIFAGEMSPGGYGHSCDYFNYNTSSSKAPRSVALASDGTLYIGAHLQISRLRPDGSVSMFAGNNSTANCQGLDCPATTVFVSDPSVALSPDGSLWVGNGVLQRITANVTGSPVVGDTVLPSADGREVYVFNGRGQHTKTLDAMTAVPLTTFGYGSFGPLISITDRDGNKTLLERDGSGNLTGIVSPDGQRTVISSDSNGYLSTLSNPAHESTYFSYDAGGLLQQLTDARGGLHAFVYDAEGFLVRDSAPDGSFQTLDRAGQLSPASVTHKTALGRTTVYQAIVSGDHESVQMTDPAGLVSLDIRNPDHTSSTQTPDGMLVSAAESADPRFGIQTPVASTTTRTPAGLVRTVSVGRSATLASAADPLSVTSLTETVAINGRSATTTYDRAAGTVTWRTPAGRQTVQTLDALGRTTKVQAPGLLPLSLTYDTRGRLQSTTQGTRVTTLAYDAAGFLHSVIDPAQHTSVFAYDLAGRPTNETLPDQSVIGMSYDASGNITSVTPPGRPAHVYSFTSADLESDYMPPDVGQPRTTHTDYNFDRQVSNVSRPDGDSITPTYDTAKGRLISLATSRGTTSYGYSSSTGQLTSITTPDGVGLAYGYDGSLLQDITWSGPVAGNVHKTYDASFRLASESVTGGQTINFGYDNDDLLTTAGAMTITRDPATGFASSTDLGAIHETYTYDDYGAEQTHVVTANGSTLYSVNYGTRDALGRIVNKTESIQGETHTFGYSYDVNGRLTDVAKDSVATSHYEYDANGNRTVGPGLTASPVYNNQDRLLSYGNCTYSYKPDSSLQTRTCPDGTTGYDYDTFGNLRGVTLPNGTAISYIVDGQHRRVGKKVNGVLVESFAYERDLNRVGWYDGAGGLKAQFVFSRRGHVPVFLIKSGTAYRLVTDQVGSVRLLLASDGSVAERIDYDEFGNVLADTNHRYQPFGFAGGLTDADISLVRFGARDYDSVTGRWTTPDPLQFGGGLTNLYGYTGNDPVNRSDPTGNNPFLWGAAAAACVGTGACEAAAVAATAVAVGTAVYGAYAYCHDHPEANDQPKENSEHRKCVEACHDTYDKAQDICDQKRSKKEYALCMQQIGERISQCISFCNQAYLNNGGF